MTLKQFALLMYTHARAHTHTHTHTHTLSIASQFPNLPSRIGVCTKAEQAQVQELKRKKGSSVHFLSTHLSFGVYGCGWVLDK